MDEDEWPGIDVGFDLLFGCARESFLLDFVVEHQEADNLSGIVDRDTTAAAVRYEVLLDESVCVDALGFEECENPHSGGLIFEVDTLDFLVDARSRTLERKRGSIFRIGTIGTIGSIVGTIVGTSIVVILGLLLGLLLCLLLLGLLALLWG